MTDTTDAVIGTVGGLMALGIMANVATKVFNDDRPPRRAPPPRRIPAHTHAIKPLKVKQKTLSKPKQHKSLW